MREVITRATTVDTSHHRMQAARRNRNRLLLERNLLLSIVSRIWPSHLSDPETQRGESSTWQVVCIHSPVGQFATKVTGDEARDLFGHLTTRASDWDRHTYWDKLERLFQLATAVPSRSRPSSRST